jgi:cell division control protein 42
MRALKCVVVGDGAVGKTCLLITYSTKSFPDYYPTQSDVYSSVVTLDDDHDDELSSTFELRLYDTAGQEDYDHFRPQTYPGTDVFLVCFCVVRPASFASVRTKWHAELAHHCPDVPRLLVGTKSDLRSDDHTLTQLEQTHERPVSSEQGDELAEEIGACTYIECSARTQNGLDNVFNEAIRTALNPQPAKKGRGKGKCSLF